MLAAAKRIAAAKGWLRPALAAADGGVVAAVAPQAAVAMPRLRAVDAMPRLRADAASSPPESRARVRLSSAQPARGVSRGRGPRAGRDASTDVDH